MFVLFLPDSLLEDLDLEEPYEEMCSPLVEDVIHPEEIVRKAASPCLAKAVGEHPTYVVPTVELLLDNYDKKLEVCIKGLIFFLVENRF